MRGGVGRPTRRCSCRATAKIGASAAYEAVPQFLPQYGLYPGVSGWSKLRQRHPETRSYTVLRHSQAEGRGFDPRLALQVTRRASRCNVLRALCFCGPQVRSTYPALRRTVEHCALSRRRVPKSPLRTRALQIRPRCAPEPAAIARSPLNALRSPRYSEPQTTFPFSSKGEVGRVGGTGRPRASCRSPHTRRSP